jgi:hypothetical protein
MSEYLIGYRPTSLKLPFKMFDRRVSVFSRKAAKLAKNPEIPLSFPFDKEGKRGL